MRIDFHEKTNHQLIENLHKIVEEMYVEWRSMETFASEIDRVFAQMADEDNEKIQTEVWQLPEREAVLKEDLKHPEEMSDSKAQTYANYLAREELGKMEHYLQFLELQAHGSFLFCNIDMNAVRKAIYEPAKAAFFDKQGHVKPEYVDLLINDYAERYEMEELAEAMDDDEREND